MHWRRANRICRVSCLSELRGRVVTIRTSGPEASSQEKALAKTEGAYLACQRLLTRTRLRGRQGRLHSFEGSAKRSLVRRIVGLLILKWPPSGWQVLRLSGARNASPLVHPLQHIAGSKKGPSSMAPSVTTPPSLRGLLNVPHTWRQDLLHYPHVQGVCAAGGLSRDSKAEFHPCQAWRRKPTAMRM